MAYLTPGLVIGRFKLWHRLAVSVGGGFEIAATSFHPTNDTPPSSRSASRSDGTESDEQGGEYTVLQEQASGASLACSSRVLLAIL
ncbi:MAG: hypothetical protein ABSE28_11895 [Candidatus Sulfotelmatobacter sp.]